MPFAGAFQTTFLGWCIRTVSGGRLLKYPDELTFPTCYSNDAIAAKQAQKAQSQSQAGQKPRPGANTSSDVAPSGTDAGTLNEKPKQTPVQGTADSNAGLDYPITTEPTTAPTDRGIRSHDSSATLTDLSKPDRSTQSKPPHIDHEDVPSADKHGEVPGNAPGQFNPELPEEGRDEPFTHTRRRSDDNETVVGDPTDLGTKSSPRSKPAKEEGYGHGDQVSRMPSTPEDAETGDDPTLVTWYGPNDPENPYNWSTGYKVMVATTMAFLTFSVYVGSSIYSAGIAGPNSIETVFGVSETSALVGLTLFVLGYGIGPMLWAPISEFPQIGRLPVYLGTLVIFVALQFPTIYAPNIHVLLAMRFLAGFFGSPALAVGGATMGDMFAPKHLAYAIGVWGCGAVCGPIFGPLLGGFVYQANGWQWPFWVLLWLSGACLVFTACFFPETSGKNILHRRMVRLRKITNNSDLKTQAELDAADMTPSAVAKMVLVRPIVLAFEPILLVYNTYLALIYGLLYLWFESFPLVFQEVHGFNSGESGLAFLGIFFGAWGACAVFCLYIHYRLEPIFDANNGLIPVPEIRLKPAPIAAVCIPIAMFGFGWTGQYASVHWIVPIIFTSFFGIGAFILFQTIFAYFGDVYYTEIGSVLTLNDLFRSSFGAAFPLFAGAMFSKLGIGGGSSLVGGLACVFVPFPLIFLKYGQRIRKASKWASQNGVDEKNW